MVCFLPVGASKSGNHNSRVADMSNSEVFYMQHEWFHGLRSAKTEDKSGVLSEASVLLLKAKET